MRKCVVAMSEAMVLIRTMALRRMAASLFTRSLATTQVIPQAATLRQCSLLHTPAQRMSNAWTPAVASGRICEATRAFSSEATSRVADAIAAEIEFEKEDYAPPPVRCPTLKPACAGSTGRLSAGSSPLSLPSTALHLLLMATLLCCAALHAFCVLAWG